MCIYEHVVMPHDVDGILLTIQQKSTKSVAYNPEGVDLLEFLERGPARGHYRQVAAFRNKLHLDTCMLSYDDWGKTQNTSQSFLGGSIRVYRQRFKIKREASRADILR